MRQTQTYSLNLVDPDDTFSPDPINQNTQKLEDQLTALGGADTALDSRVAALEGHKLAVGSYAGNGSSSARTIRLGFKPRVLFLQVRNNGICMATQAFPYGSSDVVITEDGFSVKNGSFHGNTSGQTYIYFAVK